MGQSFAHTTWGRSSISCQNIHSKNLRECIILTSPATAIHPSSRKSVARERQETVFFAISFKSVLLKILVSMAHRSTIAESGKVMLQFYEG